nr:phosphotransferase [Deinococcus sp. 14RED07]
MTVDLDPSGRDWRDAALDDLEAAAGAGVLPGADAWAARVQAVPDLRKVVPVPIHGDFAAEHVSLDGQGRLSGVLDWSDAALGDPARDLAADTDSVCFADNPELHRIASSTSGTRPAPTRIRSD